MLDQYIDISDEELEKLIAEGHNYCFVGKVGQFCPIKEGRGGGLLCRESKDKHGNVKYAAPSGSKGYRWLESETVKQLNKEDDIDRSFYDKLIDDAADAIAQYGDLEWFISDDKSDIPPWVVPCGDEKYETCFDCPNFRNDKFHTDCNLNYDISGIVLLNKKGE